VSEIKVGDLVVIVKPNPCGCDKGVGTIFMVEAFDRSNRWNSCAWCGKNCGTHDQACGEGHAASLYKLRRIPPLWELDETEHKEELPA
jgi:hypothetical protein